MDSAGNLSGGQSSGRPQKALRMCPKNRPNQAALNARIRAKLEPKKSEEHRTALFTRKEPMIVLFFHFPKIFWIC